MIAPAVTPTVAPATTTGAHQPLYQTAPLLLGGGPVRLHPRPGRRLDRRWSRTVSWRRGMIRERHASTFVEKLSLDSAPGSAATAPRGA